MVLREFGLTKDFIKDMEIDVFEAPLCECGCGNNVVIVLESGNEKYFVGSLLTEVFDCPKSLAIVKKHKKVLLYFRSDLMGGMYDGGILVYSINKNANVAKEIRKFIEKHEIHHVGVFNYGTHNEDKILEIVK